MSSFIGLQLFVAKKVRTSGKQSKLEEKMRTNLSLLVPNISLSYNFNSICVALYLTSAAPLVEDYFDFLAQLECNVGFQLNKLEL